MSARSLFGRLAPAHDMVRRGMQQGERRMLRPSLVRRFVLLPEWVERRLEAADAEQLEVWAEQVLGADCLESVFR